MHAKSIRRILCVLLCLFLLPTLFACGKKDSCPRCSQKVDFSTQTFCPNCGMAFSSIKPDGYTETNDNDNSSKADLIGTWVIDTTNAKDTWNWSGEFYHLIDFVSNDFPSTISFYRDGTYTLAEGWYGRSISVETKEESFELELDRDTYNGHYAIVHDGSTIEFDGEYYHKFSQKEDILELIGENGTVFTYTRK